MFPYNKDLNVAVAFQYHGTDDPLPKLNGKKK